MNKNSEKIKSFTQLDAWKEGHKLVVMIYEVTKNFPEEEVFGLISQIRRAVVSITSNIAEGFGRRSYKEKIQFYYTSQASVVEVQNQLLIARDVGYLSSEGFKKLADQTIKVHKIVGGLIKSSKIHNS